MEREIKRGMDGRAGGREGGWGCDSGRPLRGSNHARIRLHPLAFVCWGSGSGESPEPDHCHFHLLPIMPFSSPAMRSCTGPWEAKRPSVGRERGATGGQSGRGGGGGQEVGPRDAFRALGRSGGQRPDADSLLGSLSRFRHGCQIFPSWLITSARAISRTVVN